MYNKLLAVFLLAAALFACQQKNQEHGHEHAAEAPALSYTLYGKHAEIFVEFKPLVVGQQSRFATHVTVLGDRFTALSDGTVTVSLIVGDKGIRQSANVPTVPGIYRLALKPGQAGTGRLVFDIKTQEFSDQIVIDSVQIYTDEKKALADQSQKTASSDVTYLKEQAWKIDFANQPISYGPFSEAIYTSGQILPAPGDEVTVSATFDGIVTLGDVQLSIGQMIQPGKTLMSISGGQLVQENLDVQLAKAKTDFEKSKLSYERAQQLIAKQLITGREMEVAKADFENSRELMESLSGNYAKGGKAIVSPIGGYLKNLLVTSGQFVAQGQPLFTISRNRKLVIRAEVAQRDLQLLSQIRSASIRLPYKNQTFTMEQLGGRILSYGRSSDPTTGYTPVMIEVTNAGELQPGTFVNIWLRTAGKGNALTVPESSLIEEQGFFYVYVQTAGESFQKREVKLGSRDGQSVEILSGITPGERIVTKGAYQIRLSSLSGALPAHGHEH